MAMSESLTFHPLKFIEEVRARPGLYDPAHPLDRADRLDLWKQVGGALFPDWDSCSKATTYDRVLQLQKKWRSFRDAYNRELRLRRSDTKTRTRKVYRYFKRMAFLGGFEGEISSSETSDVEGEPKLLYNSAVIEVPFKNEREEPMPVKKQKAKKKRRRSSGSIQAAEEIEIPMPLFSSSDMTESDIDSDRLFLMSFAPEMRQLPVHLKMWARAQIANIMQEAINCYCNNTVPQSSIDPDGSCGLKSKDPDLDLSD